MTAGGKRPIAVVLIAVLAAGTLPGCSTFKAEKRPNLTPFAEHIIAMSENTQYGLSEEPTIWLNKYASNPEIAPLLAEFRQSATDTRRILRAIVAHSIGVVTPEQSRATVSERSNAPELQAGGMGPAAVCKSCSRNHKDQGEPGNHRAAQWVSTKPIPTLHHEMGATSSLSKA